MMTTRKTGPGTFDVLFNGQPTKYTIFNGDLGTRGRSLGYPNMYGIARGESITWVGSLAACKKLLARRLEIAR